MVGLYREPALDYLCEIVFSIDFFMDLIFLCFNNVYSAFVDVKNSQQEGSGGGGR